MKSKVALGLYPRKISSAYNMYPQAEYENYKLQVELLQEKLQRSEENRHQLEQKLEQILQKRSEHDKAVRAKARQRQKEFLEEQQKRNERNKLLVKMLERIDEQSAALSARSERLKMMKMQYEMYFAKLVQTQTMRCIQTNTAAATANAIPVLVPTATATTSSMAAAAQAAINMNEHTTSLRPASYQLDGSNIMPEAAVASAAATFCLTPSHNFNDIPPPPLPPPQRQWALAMATPTPAGMLLNNTPTAAANTLLDFDYLKYPIGYLPAQMHFAYQQQAAAAAAAAVAFASATAAAAAAAVDDDLLSTQRSGCSSSRQTATLDEIGKLNDDTQRSQQQIDNSNINIAPVTINRDELKFNKISLHHDADVDTIMTTKTTMPAKQATSPNASTATSTSLTFDELPHGKAQASADISDENVGAAGYMGYDNSNNNYSNYAPKSQGFINVSGDSDNSHNNKNNHKAVDEKSLNSKSIVNVADVLDAAAVAAADAAPDNAANHLRRQKIDESWVPLHSSQYKGELGKDNANDGSDSNISSSINTLTPYKPNDPSVSRNFYDDTFGSSDNAKNKGEVAAAAPPLAGSYQPVHFERKEKMSIENIENEFYGELVKPPTTTEGEGVATTVKDLNQHTASAALTATSELLEELTATKPTVSDAVDITPAKAEIAAAATTNADYAEGASAEPGAEYDANYAYQQQAAYADDGQNYANEGDNYTAAVESYAASEAEGYQQQENMAYSDEVDPSQEYQQYATDPNLAGSQDYDYQQYDAAAYQNAYDPNAYPGYIYDEATGQYTADSNQQYEGVEGAYTAADYAQQGYDEAAIQQQQQQQQQQQEAVTPNYDYTQYQQQQELPTTAALEPTTAYAEPPAQNEILEPISTLSESSLPTPPTNATPTPASTTEAVTPSTSGPTKPTSILAHSAADGGKTAANEAQQQKKKKRVNFVDSSETDDSSTMKPDGAAGVGAAAAAAKAGDSDFDFSSSSGSGANTATNN